MAQNINVQTGDVILVPPSDIVLSDRWIDQNIRQLLARHGRILAFSYNINSNPKQ